MTRPSVLFVGTRRTSAEVNAAVFGAREAGYDVALLAPEPPRFSRGLLADVELVDLFDRPRALDAGLALARRASVRGVVTWMDTGVELAAAIAARMGLPGPSREAARRARNKHEMRSALATHPDLIPRFKRVTTLDELQEAASQIGFPAVLKPSGGNGSKGILQIDADTDLPRIWELARTIASPRIDPVFADYEGEHLYEERLGGSEHSVEGFVHDGTVLVAGITDKWVTEDHYLEYEEVHPSAVPEEAQQRIVKLTHRVVEAIGLDDCPFHLECRLLADGSVRLLEIAARPAGGYITSHLVPLSSGIRFHANCIRVATGDAPDMHAPGTLYAGRRAVIGRIGGSLERLDGLDAALRLWGVEHVVLERTPGSEIVLPPAQALSSNLASVICRCAAHEEVRELLGRAVEEIHPQIEPQLRRAGAHA